METVSGQRVTVRRREGARGRRERRLRAEARIRLQLCRDAVRIASHRGGEGYKAREGEVREQHHGLRAQEQPLPWKRPAPLLEVLPQVGAQRHAVDQIVDVPWLPTLDGPVPLMVEQLVDVLQILDALIRVAEQAFDVPRVHPAANLGSRAAAGGTAGVTRDCGAERGHSSSSWSSWW